MCAFIREVAKEEKLPQEAKIYYTFAKHYYFLRSFVLFFMSRFEKFPPMSFEMIGKVKERNPLLFRVSIRKNV